MPLTVIHQGTETVVDDQTTALIGSDATSTIRIVRPGISRRHALISYDGTGWKIEDAGSRNGTFIDGKRVTVTSLDGSTTCYLGHPTDGEKITLVPADDTPADKPTASSSARSGSTSPAADPSQSVSAAAKPAGSTSAGAAPAAAAATAATAPAASSADRTRTAQPTRVQQTTTPRASASASDVEIAQLTSAIRAQVKSIRNLTWSVWAMIAVTAILIVLTLFVGILSN